MRKIYSISLLILMISTALYSQQYVRYTQEIDTPTAYTIPMASYSFSMLAYDEGGLEFKVAVGLHDKFMLGVSFDSEHAIGKDTWQPNVPGVVAKVKFTDGSENFPIAIALGYDSFYLGPSGKAENNVSEDGKTSNYDSTKYNRMIYGPYFVITKPIYLFDEEQHTSLGFRLPAQPDFVPRDSSYFFSFDIPVGQYFTFKSELERVYWNFSRNSEWLVNAGVRYNIFTKVGVELNLIMQYGIMPNRVVRVEYTDAF